MKSTICLLSLLVLGGCMTGTGLPGVQVEPCEHVQITNVTLEYEHGELTVRGVLRSRSAATHRVDHVDIDLLDREGRVLARLKAEANVHMHMRRSARPPEFSATGPGSGVSKVRLSHHAAAFGQCGL